VTRHNRPRYTWPCEGSVISCSFNGGSVQRMSIWSCSWYCSVLKLNWWWKFHLSFKRREDPTKLYYRRTALAQNLHISSEPASLVYLGNIEPYITSDYNNSCPNFKTYICTVCEATLGITGWILWGVLIDTEDYYLDVGLSYP